MLTHSWKCLNYQKGVSSVLELSEDFDLLRLGTLCIFLSSIVVSVTIVKLRASVFVQCGPYLNLHWSLLLVHEEYKGFTKNSFFCSPVLPSHAEHLHFPILTIKSGTYS